MILRDFQPYHQIMYMLKHVKGFKGENNVQHLQIKNWLNIKKVMSKDV